MCGILGAVGKFELEAALEGLDLVSHRGPDSVGYYYDNNLFLGHHRLSIQDTSQGANQPFYSKCKRYVMIYNGEIYNQHFLRSTLLKNFNFTTTGDTELLLEAYIKYGFEIFSKINGIFAFSIYDFYSKELVIARDQFGVKPLYYYFEEDLLLFGSELKSFLPFNINKEISNEAILNYLCFLWSPGELTPFKHVKKLLPGTAIRINLNETIEIETKTFYEVSIKKKLLKQISEEAVINALESKLLNAVERQLLSDVPIGFFLSGGLDSSLLVAMARKLKPDFSFQCYTIDLGLNGRKHEGFVDDLGYAKRVANYLKVDLNIVKSDISIVQFFDKIIWHLDEPQADAAPANVWKISKLAHDQNIKVLIGGTAGDDLFSGYRRHRALNMEKFIQKTPRIVLTSIQYVLRHLRSDIPVFRRLQKLGVNLQKTSLRRQLGYFSWLDEGKAKSLFTQEINDRIVNYDPYSYFLSLSSDFGDDINDLERMLFWELKTFLVDHNLNYTDKLSMAVGVESRVPFLDVDLVEYSMSIPADLKMKGKETKYILKKVAERYLPHDIIYRPKTGFGAPVRSWITNELEPLIQERLAPDRILKRGLFNPDKVWELINLNKSGKIDASYSIWALLALESWCIQFIDGMELYKVKN